MAAPLIYRKRFIPFETVQLKDDEIIEHSKDILLTKWKPIKPRSDFSHGCSCVFLNNGIKVSKIYNKEKFIYYYCDIVEAIFSQENNSYLISDLLVDVIVMPDGFVKVVDVEELTYALDKEIITLDILKNALNRMGELLEIIYSGKFSNLTKYVDEIV